MIEKTMRKEKGKMGEWRKTKRRLLAGVMSFVLLAATSPMHILAEGTVSNGDVAEESAADSDAADNAAVENEDVNSGEDSVSNEGENIASGVDGDITWVIDGEGKLTISGRGDFSAPPVDSFGNVNPDLWGAYVDFIVSADNMQREPESGASLEKKLREAG